MWFCSNCGGINEENNLECINCNEKRNQEIKSEILNEGNNNSKTIKRFKSSKIFLSLKVGVCIIIALTLIGMLLPEEENIHENYSENKKSEAVRVENPIKSEDNISKDSLDDVIIDPWEAIALIEELTGYVYADSYDISSGKYENAPEIVENSDSSYYIIPIMNPYNASYAGEFYVDIFTGDIYDSASDSFWLLKDSNIRALTFSDIENLSDYEIRTARNEIFARHGYIFNSEDLRYYFENKAWYKPNPNYNDNMLSEIEKSNIEFLLSHENNR